MAREPLQAASTYPSAEERAARKFKKPKNHVRILGCLGFYFVMSIFYFSGQNL